MGAQRRKIYLDALQHWRAVTSFREPLTGHLERRDILAVAVVHNPAQLDTAAIVLAILWTEADTAQIGTIRILDSN
jgi:hypothetical protein